ncbi:MAG: hypothetical protein JWN04_3277 [Myxococcaceae bacterium]|nr:hypothetical protein [Myxococcaceae bacterium]
MKASRGALPGLVLALACLAIGSARAADKAPASAFAGQWEIERVLPDQGDPTRWAIRTNSPPLMYRRFVITDSTAGFADGEPCQQRWIARSSTWGELFRIGFLRGPGPARAVHPEPEDFALVISKQTRVKAYPLCFEPNAKNPWLGGQWVVFEGSDRMIMHFDETLIFVLRRVPERERPQASFSCAEAATPTEKAICGNAELASWDRSVAEALRQLAWRGANADEIHDEQRAWLRARDQCGANAACLATSMRNRTWELASW